MISTLLIISMACTSTAFSYRELHPAALFPYFRAAVESDIARPFVNPAHLADGSLFFIEASHANPYNLDGLSSNALHLGVSQPSWGSLFSWESFGIDEYREDVYEASVGFKIGNFLHAGISPSISKLAINTEIVNYTDYFINCRAGISISPFKWIELAYHQDNIRSIFKEEGRDIHYPGWSAGSIIRPTSGLSISWNINKTYFSYINTFAASANVLKNISISGGYSRETSSLAGAITVLVNGIAASYGIRYHSFLGTTHSFSAAYRFNSPTLEEIRYSKPKKSSCKEPINLLHCNAEDLERAGIETLVAKRIVKFRETTGPLSKTSLIQMGMSSKEFKRLSTCFANLADERTIENKKTETKEHVKKKKSSPKVMHQFPYRNAEARKLLFQKLITEGVKASSALRICELAKDLTRQKLVESIAHLSYLNDNEKSAAKKVCAAQ